MYCLFGLHKIIKDWFKIDKYPVDLYKGTKICEMMSTGGHEQLQKILKGPHSSHAVQDPLHNSLAFNVNTIVQEICSTNSH